ncbi:carboxypeptidase-like regulatory domain-containing protein [Tautonia plasticadhaerens]|uniref:Carboxypeptidase regulatory-like domain-containing protein n=1 Tax=Tautonia plasticadhaerens TaxID=2527974 RepID=A0A518H0U9_9BACT|nr:carboxypeptidase-like regulatory domain-containing protein [Tautonia plasticadhaerens]QDV34475.1 hypothetical protein ElP_23640 [Tautonia plasticadhaerens]
MSLRSIAIRLSVTVSVIVALIVAGCGGGPKLVPVSGVVTLDGEPLEGATLSFVPAAGNVLATAGSDVSGPNGNFMMTYKGRNGLSPGTYRVLVSKTEEIEPPKNFQVPPEFAKASFEKQLMGLTKETIPPQSFEHEIEVPEDGATDFALDFKSKEKS